MTTDDDKAGVGVHPVGAPERYDPGRHVRVYEVAGALHRYMVEVLRESGETSFCANARWAHPSLAGARRGLSIRDGYIVTDLPLDAFMTRYAVEAIEVKAEGQTHWDLLTVVDNYSGWKDLRERMRAEETVGALPPKGALLPSYQLAHYCAPVLPSRELLGAYHGYKVQPQELPPERRDSVRATVALRTAVPAVTPVQPPSHEEAPMADTKPLPQSASAAIADSVKTGASTAVAVGVADVVFAAGKQFLPFLTDEQLKDPHTRRIAQALIAAALLYLIEHAPGMVPREDLVSKACALVIAEATRVVLEPFLANVAGQIPALEALLVAEAPARRPKKPLAG